MERNEVTTLKSYLHPHVHCSIIYKAKICKQLKCPSLGEQIRTMGYTHSYNEILFSHKRRKPCHL